MDQWERFADRANLALADLGWEQTIEVYNSSVSYSGAGDGYDQGDYGSADTTLDAATLPPSSDPQIESDGLENEYDLVCYIPSDTTATIRTYRDESETPTRIKVIESGIVYETQSAEDQGNGLTRLSLTEVDN